MAQSLGDLIINVKGDTTYLVQGFDRAERVVNKTTKSMGNAIKALAGAYVSLSAIDLAKSYAKQVDAITTVNNRLKLVTKSTQELTTAQNELYKISQSTSMSYASTGDLYSRVARSTKELNLSQTELLGITDSINKAMIISGGTAESMNAALVQLGQAFSADFKAVGQELGSIREQTPRLYEAIVKGMGVTSGQFKKMAEDGKLSSEMIINALKSQGVALNEEYAKFTKTIDQSFQNLSNSGQKVINDFDKITGISKSVSENIIGISSAIDSLDVEQIANLAEYAKNAAIAIGLSYTALKAGTIAVSAYNSILESNNRINKLNIDIETSKAKAYSDGMKALYARKIADEALNTGMLNGIELSKKKINQLQKEATTLENVAKRQQAYSYQLEGTARGFNIATLGANALRTALNTIPFMALSVGLSLVISKLLETGKEQEKLNEIMNSSKDKLKENTDAQLKYALSLLESETATLRLARANAIAAASSQGMFQSEQDFKKDQSNRDVAIKSFDENIKKIREIKDLLAEKNQNNLLGNNKGTSSTPSFDTSSIDDMVNKVLNPYQSKLDEINKKWKEQFDILKKNGKDTTGVTAAWNAEIQKLNEDTAKANEKSLKAENKSIEERISQYANYYEKIKDFSSLWAIEEQRLRKENTALTESELNKLLEIERQNFNERFTLQKDILNADDWKEYYLKIGQYEYAWQIELSENFDKWKALAGEKLPELVELYKTEFFDKISKEEIKPFEFDIDLDGFDTPITNTLKSFDKLNEATKEYNKYIKQTGLTKEQIAKADEQNTSNQLKGYSNMAGAISEMFEKGSREAAAFQIAQASLALVEGTRAVIAQGIGDPYTAIPRMIAMGAMVSSLLSNIGVAFGMNSDTETHSGIGLITENTGMGTVLGQNKASKSISNSLSILEDYAKPQFQVLSEMNKNVKTIADNIGGVARILVNNSDFALGEGFKASSSTKQAISLSGFMQDMVMPIDTLISKIPIIGNFMGLDGVLGSVGGLTNKVLGSVFGKTSVKTTLQDAGYVFADTLLTTAISEGIDSQSYQYVKIKKSKKSVFGSSSSTKYKTYYGEGLDEETSNQFSLVLGNIYDTVLSAGLALDSAYSETESKLSNYVVSLGKISLLGKTQEQIQELLINVFSAEADKIARTAFPLLDEFQQVGEGLFETMTRVATGMEEAEYYASRLGKSYEDIKYTDILNKQGNVGFEALLQSIVSVEEKLYPVNNGLMEMVSNLDLTAEELYQTYVTLDELRDRLIFLKQEAQGLSSSMVYGAGSVADLQKGLDSFFENFLTESENLVYETEQLIQEFNKLNIALPVSKDSFKDLLSSLDLTSESGQELYGRLIILSESFANVADKTAESIAKLESELLELTESGIDDLSESFSGLFNSIKSLKDIATSFINSFSTSSLGNTREQIIQYNKLRKQFEGMFDSTGKLNANVTEKEAKDIYSKLSGLGTAIGKSQEDLQKDLVSQFEMDLSKLDMSEEILKVDIVSGLSDLLGLNESQKAELQNIAKDGTITRKELESIGKLNDFQLKELFNVSDRLQDGIRVTDSQIQSLTSISDEQKRQLILANQDGIITNNELSKIGSLTETQKNGILDFAKNSSLFSTEETLYSLNEYMKKQLEVLQKTQAEETASLSKQTLTYGDYVGKQEQIDIAKLLGVNYESAKPLIEQAQALSVSKNATSDIQKMLGYSAGATSYNTTMASQLKALEPYLNYDISGIISGVEKATSANLAEQKRKEAIATATAQYEADYASWQKTISSADTQLADFWATLSGGSRGDVFKKYFTGVNDYQTALKIRNSITGSDNKTLNDSTKDEEFLRILKIKYDNQNPPLLANYLKGYAVGAVDIPYDQIAQIHKNEMIIPATFAEGLRNGDLTLSGNMNNNLLNTTTNNVPILLNFSIFEDIKGIISDISKNISDYPQKTFKILDDVVNGLDSMNVKVTN